jgi:endo-1,4-beta-D-glucanase Y
MTAALLLALSLAADHCPPRPWPLFARYVEHFVSTDGRVVDRTHGGRTVSEGQAYLAFLSLAAGDRAVFDRALRWTADNLARGHLEARLPAWLWGRDEAGTWRVLDDNAAADADLWMGYALVEAGRLWSSARYDALGRALLANVVRREVAELPRLGPTLLPAPRGFEIEVGRAWRLNPSYLPPEIARGLASAGVPGPWNALLTAHVRILRASSERGWVPDWTLFRDGRFEPDPVTGRTASYDAIRVYLWNGMLPEEEPLRPILLAVTAGPSARLARRSALAERVDASTGAARGLAPPGFLAALIPDALARGDHAGARWLLEALDRTRSRGLYGDPPAYYDQDLALFGQGFAEERFRFTVNGRLAPEWEGPCQRR